MRVALIIDRIASNVISGSLFEQTILREIDSLENSGYAFFVITNSDLNAEKPIYEGNIKYISRLDYQNGFNKYPNSFRSRLALRLISSRLFRMVLKPSLIESIKQSITSSPLSMAVKENKIDIGWNIYSMEMLNIPYLATCLDCSYLTYPFLPENNLRNYWMEWNDHSFPYYRRASFILAGTDVMKTQLKNFYGIDGDKIFVNPFFTPVFEGLETTFDALHISELVFEDQFLFYPARYAPQKNHIVIIEALKILKEKWNFTPKVVFCGRDIGNLEYLKYKVSEYSIADQFAFLGLVDFPSLNYLYRHAKALVYTSFVGPDNLPPLEAFSYECPVIASNVSGAVEQLGDAALLFEPTDEMKLVDHIQTIYEKPHVVKKLIEKGKKIAEMLTVQNYVANVLKIFDVFSKYHRAWGDSRFNSKVS